MTGRVPTPEQRAAIETESRTVLVEAGAGTGKTGVMVDRYCRLVCDELVSPDAVLAFTFTDKAAAELRQRIRAAIMERADRGSERARELLPSLGGAWVTTIHGFCSRLLAGHPVAVGIDPRFRVLDAPEAERVEAEAFDQALEAFLAADDPDRERTIAAFDIGGLRAMVSGVHAELRSRGVASPRLPEPPEVDLAGALRRVTEVAAATLEEVKPTNSNRDRIARAVAVLDAEEVPDLDTLCGLRTTSKAQPLAAYREAIDAAVCRAAEADEGGLAYRHVAELLELFSERFSKAKERRAAVDFEDLQLLAVRLLERETGADYRARFSHLLVDEFQDTNRLQLRLVEALRGPETRLMVVGDELQSIYGFRHADLDVFREQRTEIEGSAEGEALALSGNFRSRPEVVGAVNAIGGALLGEEFKPLRVGSAPEGAQPEGAAVELLLTGSQGWDDDRVELDPATDARSPLNVLAEARFVAARLRELADAGVERGEMVVLLRAFSHLDAYEDSLERAGLRPYVVGGRGYWSQQQVADVCALLATIANPLDDQALFGALASPACGVAPDTLWLLRAAAGARRHVWPAVERLSDLGEDELEHPERLEAIPAAERGLLRQFAERVSELRDRAPLLSLPSLIDAAVTETGYDLAVLMRHAGEARFANVRKLMRLAGEYEAVEGRDLRGLLDFLAARADADADAQAATAVEGHDGVRIMTIHSAKGLEFDVVAVPQLGRRLFAAGWRSPMLTVGHELTSPRVGMNLRRLGAPSLRLFSHPELCEEQERREVEEELRLFHVAMTRARERLVLSGVVEPKPAANETPGRPVVERIATAFGIDRARDSVVSIPAPEARPGLDCGFAPSELQVRVSLASPQRAEELRLQRKDTAPALDTGEGPAPLLEKMPAPPPIRPLSYTAISEQQEISTQDGERVRPLSRIPGQRSNAGAERDREEAAAYGIAVHSLLEWSQANDWREPPEEVVGRFLPAAGLEPTAGAIEGVLTPLRDWKESALFEERIQSAERVSAEVPILLDLDGTVLRGSIDLLVEKEGEAPLIVDYKTDRLDGAQPAVHAERYSVQRAIYALAVAEAREAEEVEIAYVFLERPEDPVTVRLSPAEIERGREEIAKRIAAMASV